MKDNLKEINPVDLLRYLDECQNLCRDSWNFAISETVNSKRKKVWVKPGWKDD